MSAKLHEKKIARDRMRQWMNGIFDCISVSVSMSISGWLRMCYRWDHVRAHRLWHCHAKSKMHERKMSALFFCSFFFSLRAHSLSTQNRRLFNNWHQIFTKVKYWNKWNEIRAHLAFTIMKKKEQVLKNLSPNWSLEFTRIDRFLSTDETKNRHNWLE